MHHHKRLNQFFSYVGKLGLSVLIVISFLLPANTTAISQPPEASFYAVRSMELPDLGISHPVGLAFSAQDNEFLVMGNPATWIGPGNPAFTKINLRELPAGSVTPEVFISDPLNMAFDERSGGMYVFDQASQELIQLQARTAGTTQPPGQVIARHNAAPFNVQNPAGLAFDPQSGSLYILDAANSTIIRIRPHPVFGFDGPSAVLNGLVNQINLPSLRNENLRGLAYNTNNGHLYTMNPETKVLYEVTETGQVESVRNLGELNLADPQALVFAPSGDSTDDPATMNLYIADSGQPSAQQMTAQSLQSESASLGGVSSADGQIIELSLAPSLALPPGTPLLPTTLVRTVDTSNAAWYPSSPDPSGIAYRPSTGRFLVVDSEVEEMPPYWVGKNVFDATTSGTLVSTCTTNNTSSPTGSWDRFSTEPTGVAINPNNGHVFISDDSGGGKIHEVRVGPDGIYCTPDDVVATVGFATDVEDVAYGNNTLFIAGGIDAEVWMFNLGPNGILGGGDDGAVTHFDTNSLGFRDLEAIAYNPDAGTLFIASTANDRYLGEVTTGGTLLRGYDLNFMGNAGGLRSGMTYAAASANPAVKNIYIVSRGIDNGADPYENDGKWWEIDIGSSPSTPTPTTTTPTPTTTTPTPTTTTPTPTDTPTPTGTPTPPPPVNNLLANPGFELDANGDGAPDSWTTASIFTRSNELVLSENFAGKLFATNNASANILNTVNNLTAGTTYDVSGWVNIPQLAGGSLSFQIKVEWRNGNTLIVRDTIKKYTAMTVGWDRASASLVAPAGTTNARVLLALSGLNGTIFLDDFVFGPQGSVPTPTATETPTPTATETVTPTPTDTVTPTATETVTPTATETVTPTPTDTVTPTATDTPTPPPTDTPTPTPTLAPVSFYFSLGSTGPYSVGSVTGVDDEDILAFHGNGFSMFFDGSDVGLSATDMNAFYIVDSDTILMSFDAPITLGSLGTVDDSDIVQFDATSLGETTAGVFSLYFDGSDVGLTTNAEDIDAIDLLADGRLVISTLGDPAVSGVSSLADEDLLVFTPTSLGANTTGTWAMYFDGSDVGLSNNTEDIDGLSIVPNGNIYLSTEGNFSVAGVSGADEDVFICAPASLGDTTNCTFSSTLFFDGSVWGLGNNDVDAIDLP